MFKYDLQLGGKQDTGEKDANGNIIYGLLLDTGVLPNATSSNTAHGLTAINLAAGAFSGVLVGYADDGGTNLGSIPGLPGLSWAIDTTNLVLTATGNLSSYTSSSVVILFTETDDATS